MAKDILVREADLRHLLNALETVDAELEQLELDEEWFSSDSTDLVKSGTEILHSYLGIEPQPHEEEDFDNELE